MDSYAAGMSLLVLALLCLPRAAHACGGCVDAIWSRESWLLGTLGTLVLVGIADFVAVRIGLAWRRDEATPRLRVHRWAPVLAIGLGVFVSGSMYMGSVRALYGGLAAGLGLFSLLAFVQLGRGSLPLLGLRLALLAWGLFAAVVQARPAARSGEALLDLVVRHPIGQMAPGDGPRNWVERELIRRGSRGVPGLERRLDELEPDQVQRDPRRAIELLAVHRRLGGSAAPRGEACRELGLPTPYRWRGGETEPLQAELCGASPPE